MSKQIPNTPALGSPGATESFYDRVLNRQLVSILSEIAYVLNKETVKVTDGSMFSPATAATETSMLLFDFDNNTVERVTVGAANSGGAGFKVLRIPN